MGTLNKYFELIPLFKTANVQQFLLLLEEPVSILITKETRCFACSLVDREERRGSFIRESPKFALDDLKIIFKWFINKKVHGGGVDTFCRDSLELIAGLAITSNDEFSFLEWANQEFTVYG